MSRNRLKPAGNPSQTFLMIAIAACLMVAIDLFVFGGAKYLSGGAVDPVETVPSYKPVYTPIEQMPEHRLKELGQKFQEQQSSIEGLKIPGVNLESRQSKSTDQAIGAINENDLPENQIDIKQWAQYAAKFQPAAGTENQPKVIIIIDDVGLSKKYSNSVVNLPAPLTLAYLPYAKNLPEQTKMARDNGHELLIHTPMEPMGENDPGPMALLTSMSEADIKANMNKIFTSFEGYVGINNHMGSRFTQDTEKMTIVMEMLKDRGLIFVDSKTSAKSVAADLAQKTGLYYAQRDVFLDHDPSLDAVKSSLERLEGKARKNGYAIAIGHPKKETVQALQEWIPTLQDKGLTLAPLSAVVKHDEDSHNEDSADLTLAQQKLR